MTHIQQDDTNMAAAATPAHAHNQRLGLHIEYTFPTRAVVDKLGDHARKRAGHHRTNLAKELRRIGAKPMLATSTFLADTPEVEKEAHQLLQEVVSEFQSLGADFPVFITELYVCPECALIWQRKVLYAIQRRIEDLQERARLHARNPLQAHIAERHEEDAAHLLALVQNGFANYPRLSKELEPMRNELLKLTRAF